MTNNREMFKKISENILAELDSSAEIELLFCASDEEFADAGEDVEIAACYEMKRETFSRLKGLKWLYVGLTGLDKILFPELVESEAILSKAEGFHSKVAAEHAIAMMLYFEKRFAESLLFKNSKEWNQSKIAKRNGTLSGKTLGLLGYGNIGQHLAEIANTFGMTVIATSRSASSESNFAHIDKVYPLSELDELISRSDYFAICVHLTSETRGLVGADKLSNMKESAVLINIARGAVVDESALIELLTNQKIRGAGLDVFATEPLPKSSPLFELDNVFLSPHVAGNFAGYTLLAAADFGKNLKLYLQANNPNNVVDKSRGY